MTDPTPHPALPADADPGLRDLSERLGGDPRVVHLAHRSATPARHGVADPPLAARVTEALGVSDLWSHQAEAINRVRRGESVVVTTGTASGKSLCYQAPILDTIGGDDSTATALLVFPTKALARDQLATMATAGLDGVAAAAYDGDCTPQERRWVRSNANVVLTNPEMLHAGILPRHDQWAGFLANLRYVVVDELHVLRGVFGSHVAHVLRRLRRLCDHYGASPVFVFTSATIGEPARLATELCGLPVTEVSNDGSPRGEQLFVLWNPLAEEEPAAPAGDTEIDDEDEPWTPTVRRRSAARDSALVTSLLVEEGRRTLAFCRGRRGTELLATEVQRRLPADLAALVEPYRGGMLARERRQVEDAMFSGELCCVVATTALELGVDIGGLDAVVLNGFPGTTASMWQQAGRAGRGAEPSVAVLVAGDDQLDQWFMAHPTEVFTRPPEPAVINPANPFVLVDQLACAAHELPLGAIDHTWWPGELDEAVRLLALEELVAVRPRHRLRPGGPVAVWSGRGHPAHTVGLRSGGSKEVRITTVDGVLVGTVDARRAPRQVHPGAIYLHRGHPWRVVALDLDHGEAVVEAAPPGEHTRARTATDISVISIDRLGRLGDVDLHEGAVTVRSQVVGFQRIETRTGRTLATEELDLPDTHLDTRAFWFTVPPAVCATAGIVPASLPGTLHAAEHAAIGMLPLFAICDRSDVGGVSTALHSDTGLPTVFIHDAHPGGAGLSELAFDRAEELITATSELIASCSCTLGCPSCVQSPKCGNGNEPLDKDGAHRLLRTIVDAEV